MSAIEASEEIFRGVGPDDIDDLGELLRDREPWLAGRAVHALSRIEDPRAHELLQEAARDQRPEVRVAAADSAKRLAPEQSDGLLTRLLRDPDVGVRKFAIRAVRPANSAAVKERLTQLAASESDPALRSMAESTSQAFDR